MAYDDVGLGVVDEPDRTFTQIPEQCWVASNDLAFAIRDQSPVSSGHTLVIPRRIVVDWWQATPAERLALLALVDEVKSDLDREFAPDGYNVGFNEGDAAGQTVFHLHLHVIPRFHGDMADPSGGVRHVIPEKGNCVVNEGPQERATAQVQPEPRTELEHELARKTDPTALTQQVLSLVDEGQRSATYKPALMLAILELAVERAQSNPTADLGLRLPLTDIADRVMAHYWPQVQKYPPAGRILRQANGPRMRVITALQALSDATGVAPTVELDVVVDGHRQAYEKTRKSVVVALAKQPIPRLQRITSGEDFFPRPLYDDADFIRETGLRKGADPAITLWPGVATSLARNATLLRMAIENVWIREVASMNEIDLEAADLRAFLFGAERVGLVRVAKWYRENGESRCFWCDRNIAVDALGESQMHVDHVIPWSYYANNGLFNLVPSHDDCNLDKRDRLIEASLIDKWLGRDRAPVDAIAADLGWPARERRSLDVAISAYRWLPEGSPVWLAKRKIIPFSNSQREQVLSALAGVA